MTTNTRLHRGPPYLHSEFIDSSSLPGMACSFYRDRVLPRNVLQLRLPSSPLIGIIDDDDVPYCCPVDLMGAVGLLAEPFASVATFLPLPSLLLFNCVVADVATLAMGGENLARGVTHRVSPAPLFYPFGCVKPIPMRRLLRTVAADRHTAPPSPATPGVVGEQQRARRALAGLCLGKVLGAGQRCQRLSYREQKRPRTTPRAPGLQGKARRRHRLRNYPAKRLIAVLQKVERVQLGRSVLRQRATLMPEHEAPEPFPQAAGLIRDRVELAGQGARSHVAEHVGRYQKGVLEPAQIALAVVDPVDSGIDWCRDRIQKMQPRRIADKNRGGRRRMSTSVAGSRRQSA
jgi:hypothetical protein